MNIKNLVLDYMRYKELNWHGHVRRMNEERQFRKRKKNGMMSAWRRRRKKKAKTSKFVDAGSNNWKEREGN